MIEIFGLLATTWATFNNVNSTAETLIAIRDSIISGDNRSLKHRELMFENDWKPFLLEVIVQQVVLILILLALPSLIPSAGDEGWRVIHLSYVVALLSIARLVCVIWLHNKDYKFIKKCLADVHLANEANARTSKATVKNIT